MADTIKLFFIFLLLSFCMPSFATPILDVAQLDLSKSQDLEPYFRYIQPDARNLTPEQALALSP